MKVIDLLNKIANEEEVPKKIRFADIVWRKATVTYENNYNDFFLFVFKNNLTYSLNDEVEIIEEDKEIEEKSKELYELCKTMYEEDREIEKLGETYINFNGCTRAFKDLNDYGGKILANKIDEIIDILNELKKGK